MTENLQDAFTQPVVDHQETIQRRWREIECDLAFHLASIPRSPVKVETTMCMQVYSLGQSHG